MLKFHSIWRWNWRSGVRVCGALGAIFVLLLGLDVVARAHARSQLQELAERAALVGVTALRDSVGQSETQRRETALAATRAVTDTAATAQVTVTASVAPISVSVELSDASGWLGRINGSIDVVGKAGYVPPLQLAGTQQVALYNRLKWTIVTARAEGAGSLLFELR
ncbi:MAG: hypothetical protein ABSC37_09460 [Xanthobacteraceae bacterium]